MIVRMKYHRFQANGYEVLVSGEIDLMTEVGKITVGFWLVRNTVAKYLSIVPAGSTPYNKDDPETEKENVKVSEEAWTKITSLILPMLQEAVDNPTRHMIFDVQKDGSYTTTNEESSFIERNKEFEKRMKKLSETLNKLEGK